jgi:hypothetical protein
VGGGGVGGYVAATDAPGSTPAVNANIAIRTAIRTLTSRLGTM